MKNEMIKRRFAVIIVSALIMLSLIIMTSCGRKDENVRIEKHVSKNDKVISSEYDDIIASDSEIKPGGEDDKIQQAVTLKEVNDKVGKPDAVEEPVEESDESSEAEDMSVSEPKGEIEISVTEAQSDSDARTVATATVVPSQHVAAGGSTITPIPTEKQSVTMPVNSPAAAVKSDTPASEFIPAATSTMCGRTGT